MFILFFLPFFNLDMILSSTDICQGTESFHAVRLNKMRRIRDWKNASPSSEGFGRKVSQDRVSPKFNANQLSSFEAPVYFQPQVRWAVLASQIRETKILKWGNVLPM
jgi:hypothetical protein